MKQYRIWITKLPEDEEYIEFDDMEEVARWFVTKDKPLGGWGIEKFDQNTWCQEFTDDDIIQLMWKMRDILLKI